MCPVEASGSGIPKKNPNRRTTMKRLMPIALLATFVPIAAQAGEWGGTAEVGFSNKTGNSRDTSLNSRFDLRHQNDLWHHEFFGDAYYARSDGRRTGERYALGYKPKRILSERDYAFGNLRYERDRFSDILARWTVIGGYGRTVYRSEAAIIDAEVGLGWRQTRYDINPDNLDRSEPIVYVGGRYAWDISDTARLSQTLRVEYGDDNTYSESVTALQLRVTDRVSAKLSHTIRHNTRLAGVRGEKVDQITGVNLVYGF
jgi:putative salt-induced outer membrane protein